MLTERDVRRGAQTVVHELPGLEVDNLLAVLALLGLLRAIEAEEPGWNPRVSWAGPPWCARLHLARSVSTTEVAKAAAKGISRIASEFEVEGRSNVSFTRAEFREFATMSRAGAVQSALAAALAAELPEKRGGGVFASPFVFMFGQGHQNFLDRLSAVSAGRAPDRFKKGKPSPDFGDSAFLERALFQPWRREDDGDGFRWDPNEDQRYALRFGDPSRAGAAPTVHGANRLASVGLLSFPCAPGGRRPGVPGVQRARGGDLFFVWPVWTEPMSLFGVERLLAHSDLVRGSGDLRALGVAEVYAARRVSNGKFMNVTRAVPRRPPA
jgi:hypothetical protein